MEFCGFHDADDLTSADMMCSRPLQKCDARGSNFNIYIKMRFPLNQRLYGVPQARGGMLRPGGKAAISETDPGTAAISETDPALKTGLQEF